MGQTFRYTVTLTNTSATPYSLRPCPTYREYVAVVFAGGRAGTVDKNYYLNCATVTKIGAHRSVRYKMELQIPPTLPAATSAKFVWYLQGDAGPAAGSVLNIVA